MIALSDTVTVAFISMIGLTLSTLGVTLVSVRGNRKRGKEAAKDRQAIVDLVQPGEAHDNLGAAIAGIEERIIRLADVVEAVRTQQKLLLKPKKGGKLL